MDYKVLYRKYRPSNFDSVLGQSYTIDILKNAIINNKIAHAYIFNGPRGTGKTSTAKIFAKTINCESPENGEACGKCNSCLNIKNNPDIIEIDAASNNGVDEIRELINNIKIAPSYGKYKVYIIDEVHMMTQSAFNALLLTLEEPPKHIVFILATTNIESVPITILSRCQKFEFKKITNDILKENIENICKKENIEITQDAVTEIAYLSEGGMRDALSILDQLSSDNKKIDLDLILQNFGTVPAIIIEKIIESIDINNKDLLKDNIEQLKNSNVDYKVFIKKMIDMLSQKAFNNEFENNMNYEMVKKIIFDLINIINNYNININPFILIELVLLENINENNTTKIISREIISEQNLTNDIQSVDKNNIQNVEKVETNNLHENITLIKNIRINNCFVNVKKEFLTDAKKKIKEIVDNNSNSILLTMLIDSDVVAASDKVYILTSTVDSIVNLININYKIIENELNNVKVVALTTDEWIERKNEYVKNLKNNYKYEYQEEIVNEELKENETINKDITITNEIQKNKIEDIAEQIFDNTKIEIN